MAEYIDREGLMKFPIRRDHCDKAHANEHFINGIETVMEYAKNLPAADVAPVVHGAWESIDSSYWRWTPSGAVPVSCVTYRCCFCGRGTVIKTNYCPNCGAKMEGCAENAAD
jgi:hypothetical protein